MFGGDFRLGSHFRATPRAPWTEDPSRERLVRAPDAEPAGSTGENQAIVRDGRSLHRPVRSTGVGRISGGIAAASREGYPTPKGVSGGGGGLPSVGNSPARSLRGGETRPLPRAGSRRAEGSQIPRGTSCSHGQRKERTET